MPDELKPVLARQMEIYAGFLEQTDHHVGRLIDALDDLGVLDDTLIYYIIGDNGASAEGTLNGCFNEMTTFNGLPGSRPPSSCSPRSTTSARPAPTTTTRSAGRTRCARPYQWTKQVASHWGGTRNGTIVHWPAGIDGQGRAPRPVPPRHRRRADHPGGRRPARADARCNGITQAPIEGVSMALHASTTPAAPERHETQYFEMIGNRGIYHQGWTAVTKHRTPWQLIGAQLPPFDDDVWELYAPRRLDPGPRPRRRAAREAAPSCSGSG